MVSSAKQQNGAFRIVRCPILIVGRMKSVGKKWTGYVRHSKLMAFHAKYQRLLNRLKSEMKLFGGSDRVALKLRFGKKIVELEDEKRIVQTAVNASSCCHCDGSTIFASIVVGTNAVIYFPRLLSIQFFDNDYLNKHSYYQKPKEVVVTIFAKGVPEKNVSINFGEQIRSVTIDVPGGKKFHFQPRLFGKIQDLKKKQENHVQLLQLKQKSDEAAKLLQEEIQFIRAQKNNFDIGKPLERMNCYSSNTIIKKDWNLWIDAGKNVVRRENIEAAVKRVMDGGDDDREG
ncbi:hypothetical protein TEA_024344 [Camellia sinensis var. sinensis]|uniref:CS domain-containing protein n=1 Tax=Camellia sinensis var. sinensis TaxID=542762 RepID=A0A4S4E4V0_CAMSN|nr:hypothetical protein TEA_024344 [Camellia sinensis var. sinensis]